MKGNGNYFKNYWIKYMFSKFGGVNKLINV